MSARVLYRVCLIGSVLAVLVSLAGTARAEIVDADPTNYWDRLETLAPGDTLQLAPGRYPRLTLRGLLGTADQWITISGPESGEEPAIIESESCCNTVQLYDCAFVAVRNLVIDVGGLDVDAINAKTSISHDIRIENNLMMNFPNVRSIVGINTKSTAWNWEIRGNSIIGAGTGIYLGGSGGDSPFINGIIENNLVLNPIGYCMQIKQQTNYSLLDGMPAGPNRTIIRNNVFIKNDRPSPGGARPNLLVSGFPDSGPGSMDRYEIYGNFIYYNPRESLFQGAGRVHMHDNVLVGTGSSGTAILLTPHQGKDIQVAHIYNNTIYGVSRGIRFMSDATESSRVVGNLVFAEEPFRGSIRDLRDNIVDSVANAGMYVDSPSTDIDTMGFYPQEGTAQGSALDLSAFETNVDYDIDFNGTSKGEYLFRGAYAGEGTNPGWTLSAERRGVGGTVVAPDGGVADGGRVADGGTVPLDGGGLQDGGLTAGGEGCACSTACSTAAGPGWLGWTVLAVGFIGLGRQRRTSR